ncbi:MAG: hypothetical protein DYG89_51770 [Caldilinea sp. CFX5]|nr:hypothetical protein [Caldilinea sp. CFX5]
MTIESNDRVRNLEAQPHVYGPNGGVTTGRDPVDIDMVRVNHPVDRVRWGAILAGLFTTISTFILLSILGLAIGASAFNPGDDLTNFGTGAGIWSAVSALIAFFVGGWMAARAAAVHGRGNGALNGAMVWIVMIPLALYLVSSGIGATLRALGGVAATGLQVAAPVVGEAAAGVANLPGVTVQSVQATAEAAGTALTEPDAQATVQAQVEAALPDVNEQQVVNAAETSTWSTLVALLLGLGAALLGGLAGARTRHRHVAVTATA